jgi:hypothetical protein
MTVSTKDVRRVGPASHASDGNVPVEDLRVFYRAEVGRASLSGVAKRARLGTSTLHYFLGGAKPHPRTRRTLELYYRVAQGLGPQENALDELTGGDPELKEAVLRVIAEHHQRQGRPVPTWLETLQRGR